MARMLGTQANQGNVEGGAQSAENEVKDLFLVKDQSGQVYNGCLLVTGKEVVLLSLQQTKVLFSHNFHDIIKNGYAQVLSEKPYSA